MIALSRARRSIRCAAMAAAVACAGWPSGAGAQAASEPALPARLGPVARSAILAIIDTARGRGLPVAPLADKAAEGALKGADDTRIVEAVRSLAAALGTARDALGGTADPSVIGAGASALRAGVTPAALRSLGEAGRGAAGAATANPEVLGTALVTLVDFVAKGVRPEVASQSIEELLRHGVAESRLVSLRSQVEHDIRGGQSPESALTMRVRDDVRRLAPPGTSPSRPDAPSGSSVPDTSSR